MQINNIEELVDEYNKNGFVKIENLLNKEELDRARKEVDLFLNNEVEKLNGKDINMTEGEVNSIHCLHKSKWFDDFQGRESIHQLVNEFLAKEGEARAAELFAKPANVGLASPDHQDNYYWCVDDANALTIWVALDDAGPDNGGIYYYKGTHKLGLLEHEASFAPGSSQTLKFPESMDVYERITPSLKAGDCLVHHSLTVHGSHANTSTVPRKGWTMQFKSKESSYDEFMKERYQRSLNEQMEKRVNN